MMQERHLERFQERYQERFQGSRRGSMVIGKVLVEVLGVQERFYERLQGSKRDSRSSSSLRSGSRRSSRGRSKRVSRVLGKALNYVLGFYERFQGSRTRLEGLNVSCHQDSAFCVTPDQQSVESQDLIILINRIIKHGFPIRCNFLIPEGRSPCHSRKYGELMRIKKGF